eukprot:s4418_g6.t1
MFPPSALTSPRLPAWWDMVSPSTFYILGGGDACDGLGEAFAELPMSGASLYRQFRRERLQRGQEVALLGALSAVDFARLSVARLGHPERRHTASICEHVVTAIRFRDMSWASQNRRFRPAGLHCSSGEGGRLRPCFRPCRRTAVPVPDNPSRPRACSSSSTGPTPRLLSFASPARSPFLISPPTP